MRPGGGAGDGTRGGTGGWLARLAGYVPDGEEGRAERRWYSTIGLAVIATSSLAVVSGTIVAGMALRMTWPDPLLVGAAWGLLILLIDTLIVRQIRYTPIGSRIGVVGAGVGAVLTFLLRLGLTIGTALLITEPVVLHVFSDAVAVQVDSDIRRLVNEYEITQYEAVQATARSDSGSLQGLQTKIQKLSDEVDRQEGKAETERGGHSAVTGSVGEGPEYRKIIRDRDRYRGELRAAEIACGKAVAQTRGRLEKAVTNVSALVKAYEQQRRDTVGYLQRRVALANIEEIASRTGPSPQAAVADRRTRAAQAVAEAIEALPSCAPAAAARAGTAPAAGRDASGPVSRGADRTRGLVDVELAASGPVGGSGGQTLTAVESRTVRTQHWILAGVLVIIDLLPLSIKSLSGRGPMPTRVRSAAADAMSPHVQRTREAALTAAHRLRLSRLERRTAMRLAGEGFKSVRHRDRLLAVHRMRQLAGVFLRGGAFEEPPLPRPVSVPPAPVPPPAPDPVSWSGSGLSMLQPLRPGAYVADWQVVEPLTAVRSAYAQLWRARRRHETEDSPARFVLKEFPITPNTQAEMKAVFDIAAVNLQYLAPVIDLGFRRRSVGQAPPRGFFVTPYYELGNLEAHFADQPLRPLSVCATYAWQIARGLQEVWSKLHRAHNDLKPQNVALQRISPERGGDPVEVRLLDWGLSVRAGDEFFAGPLAGGTPFYAPPERWRGEVGQERAALVDVYGMGATLYWMVTGRPPLLDVATRQGVQEREARLDFLRRGLQPTPVQQLVPALPGALADLIDRWVDPDPLRRVKAKGAWLKESELPDAHLWAWGELHALAPAFRGSNAWDTIMAGPGAVVDVVDLRDGAGAAATGTGSAPRPAPGTTQDGPDMPSGEGRRTRPNDPSRHHSQDRGGDGGIA